MALKHLVRKTALCVAVTALLASTAACSSGGTSAATGKKELTVWTFKQSHVAALQAVGQAWTKKSGVKVKVVAYTPDAAYATKVRSAAKTGALPDVLSVHSQGEEWLFAQAGILKDITNEYGDLAQDKFLPGVAQASLPTEDVIKGSGTDPVSTLKDLKANHVYAVPYLAGTPGVVYVRKSTLESIGLSEPPRTWEAWVEAMRKTKEKDAKKGGLVTGLQVPETGYFWLYRPMSYALLGREAFKARQGKNMSVGWNSAESKRTLELYNKLTDLWTPGVLSLGID